MADNDEERQRRRLEAKREYNRVLSAQKRQRTKDEITALAAKAEFYSDRADKLEKKNAELLQQIQILTAEHQRLSERIQYLTCSSSTNSGGVGLGHGPPTNGLLQSSCSIGGGRPDLATATFGTAAGSPPLSTGDQRYNLHLAGHLSGTARSNGGGFDPMLGISSSRSTVVPSRQQQPLLLDQLLASSLLQPNNIDTTLAARQRPLSTQELDLLIRLNNVASRKNNSNTSSFPINAFPSGGAGHIPRGDAESLIQRHGILAAAAAEAEAAEPLRPPDYATTTTIDPLLQLLVSGGAGQPGRLRNSRDALSIPVDDNMNIRAAQLLRQQAAALLTGSSQSATASFLDQQDNNTTYNQSRNE